MNKVSISINNISKKYDQDYVIKDFSYDFLDRGLYILFGKSGSGKTTLLNIISGAISFDSGSINIYDKKYEGNVNYDNNLIAYITQNTYFINYLTVFDNLKLCNDDVDKIKKYLKGFEVIDKISSYPNELSGGERQRIAIIMALLQNRKIILLDEPTANLDYKNSKKIIDLLQELKKDCLIICATHDSDFLPVADAVIDFNNLKNKIIKNKEMVCNEYKKIKKKSLFKYMFKSLTYKGREKKSSVFLVIAFSIIFLIIYACFDYDKKIEQGLINEYDINFVKYYCEMETNDYCESIVNEYNAVYNMFPYSDNVVLGEAINEAMLAPVDYNIMAKTLPFDKSLLPNAEDYLLYGTYYEDELDIILGVDLARTLTDDIKTLIGDEYTIKMQDKEETFRIVGIFKDLNDDAYFQSLFETGYFNEYEYLNSKYTEKYRDDGILGYNELEGHAYQIAYFDNTKDLYDFYKTDNPNIFTFSMNYGFVDFIRTVETAQYYGYPLVIFAFLVTLMFYFQTKYIASKYNNSTLAIYKYLGYSWKNIFINNTLVTLIWTIILYILAFILSIILGSIINMLLIHYEILMFDIFMVDYKNILILFIFVLVFVSFYAIFEYFKLKKYSWIDMVKKDDDLL